MLRNFKIKSFCKVNLSLKVLKKLNNGYHAIESLITFCDLHDLISISRIRGGKDEINFSGKFGKKIDRKKNTLAKVLELMRKYKYINNQPFKINVQKNIPLGSGLGGGSANAASLLNFLISKSRLRISSTKIKKIAEKIGSDVVVSLVKRNTFLNGNPGRMLRLKKNFKLNILIVYPQIVCSTKKIYNKNRIFSKNRSRFIYYVKNKNQLISFLKNDKNDLQKTVINLYPKIGTIIDLLKNSKGCYFSRITGSGSACIGIFSDKRTAVLTQKMIKSKFPTYWSVVSKTI